MASNARRLAENLPPSISQKSDLWSGWEASSENRTCRNTRIRWRELIQSRSNVNSEYIARLMPSRRIVRYACAVHQPGTKRARQTQIAMMVVACSCGEAAPVGGDALAMQDCAIINAGRGVPSTVCRRRCIPSEPGLVGLRAPTCSPLAAGQHVKSLPIR